MRVICQTIIGSMNHHLLPNQDDVGLPGARGGRPVVSPCPARAALRAAPPGGRGEAKGIDAAASWVAWGQGP
jgi:hypothetical protein